MFNKAISYKFLGAVTMSLGLAHSNTAAAVTFIGNGGSNLTATPNALAAAVTFELAGTNLKVTLTNTSSADSDDRADLLTSVFFNTPNFSGSLTPVSATIPTGSSLLNSNKCARSRCTTATTNVGGEFAYATGINNRNVLGATRGISSSGVGTGIFGVGNFNGPELDSSNTTPNIVDGISFGLVSAGHMPGDDTNPLKNNALIDNTVVFLFSGLPSNYDLNQIDNVYLQYGSSFADHPRLLGTKVTSIQPDSVGVSEPSLIFGFLSIGGFGLSARLKRQIRL